MNKVKSVYGATWGFKDDITITLNHEEQTMICNALVMCAPKEVDILPIMELCDRICKGGDRND